MLRVRTHQMIVVSCICLLSLTGRPCLGQLITGDILGTIRDSTGAVVPAATVTLFAVDTGLQRESTSDDAGNYFFAQLKPGHYNVQASKQGFQTTTITNVELLVTQRPRVDITLQVGAVTQKVEVSAGGVQLLETQTSDMGQVIQEQPIVGLPLNGRNFITLAYLAVGVESTMNYSAAVPWVGQNDITISGVGMREGNTSYLVDGIETRSPRFGNVGLRPSIDAIQEFKVQIDNFSAEYGHSSVLVNTSLKQGSNVVHGSAFEFLRNSSLDANSFFSNLSAEPRTPFKQNNFGFSLGGPVELPKVYHGRDKTFFFINYEGLRSRQGLVAGTGLVPSAAQFAGNLADDSAGTGILPTSSALCQSNSSSPKCYNVIDPTTGLPFPGNVIPPGRFTTGSAAVAQKWLPYIPAPNVSGVAGTVPSFNYITSPIERNDMNQANARLDHSLSSKDQIYGSYSFEDRPHTVPGVMPLSGLDYPLRNQLLAISEVHIFTPNVVNVARFGYNRTKTFRESQTAGGSNYAQSDFGFTNTSTNAFDFGVPDASFSGFTGVGSLSEAIGATDGDYEFYDNVSIVHGRHNLKLGASYMHEKFWEITDFSGNPYFTFDGHFTGTGLGDFLLGDPFEAEASVGDSHQNLRSNFWAGYIQDDWRVRPTLTFNLGFRYEKTQTPFDVENRTQWFDPAIGAPVTSLSGGVRNGIVDPDWKGFGPRVGFAYNPGFAKDTVVRGSFGIFPATDSWNTLQLLVLGPAFYSTQTIYSDTTSPTISLANVFPAATLGGGTSSPSSINKTNRYPYVLEWDLNVQHTFRKDWLLSVGYIGNRGNKLEFWRNENQPSIDPTGLIPITERERWPNYSWINDAFNGGWSSYNGLTAQMEKRLSSGLYLLASYTYSHALNVGGSLDRASENMDFNVFDKQNTDYDQRQRLVVSYVYELPFGRGKKFLSGVSRPANHLLGGWKFNGIASFASGQFESPELSEDWLNVGLFTESRPNKVGNPYVANPTYLNWYTSSAYVAPGCPSVVVNFPYCGDGVTLGDHVEGNAGKRSLVQPGTNNWDIALLKDTRLRENFTVEFRAEFFNTWNHVQWGAPSATLDTTFGTINSLLVDPREIQFGLKFLW
jgi:hypothetical protein